MRYRDALKNAKEQCIKIGVGEQAPLFLLLELTEREAHNLYMEYEEEMEGELLIEYNQKVNRLLQGEPLDHILGYSYFYGYRFVVDERVLIPRPETEELVANILNVYDEHFPSQPITLIDVGSGSGAIAISLKLEEKNIQVSASDISEDAIAVASTNAKTLGAEVSFLVGNMLEPFIENNYQVDILVSNPPYIPKNEKMEQSVIGYEPHVALFGGEDGLHFYREIFKKAHLVIKERSILAFEIGYDQKEILKQEAKKYFKDDRIEVYKDMNGKNRMLFIYHNC